MVRLLNNAEGGTNGTTVTTANTDGVSGDAFPTVSIGAGAGITFSNTAPPQGALSYRFVNVTGVTNYLRWDWTASPTVYFGAWVRFTTAFSVATEIVTFRSSASSTMASINATTSNRLNLTIMGVQVSISDASAVVDGANMWVEAGINRTTGVWNFRVLASNGTTVIWNDSGTATTLPTADIGQVRFGKTTASTAASDQFFDSLTVDSTKITLEGPPSAAVTTNPTADAAQDAGTWAVIDATGSEIGANGTGTLAYSISPSTSTYQFVTGKFLVPANVLYTITVTEGSRTATTTITPVAAAGGGTERVRWNGTGWV